jgi:hypothetical protein
MRLPFTVEQFFDVFRRYNEAVWPAQWVLLALAGGAVVLSFRDRPADRRVVSALLAALWLWMAVAYHFAFFASVNRMAILFGVAFAAQAALFAGLAIGSRSPGYRPAGKVAGLAGTIVIAYALIGYPVLGHLLGHEYPMAPTFGVPCPTTIFTLGLLLWSNGRMPRRVFVIPVLWALVGTSAAATLGVTEDYGLLVAALVAVALTAATSGGRFSARASAAS